MHKSTDDQQSQMWESVHFLFKNIFLISILLIWKILCWRLLQQNNVLKKPDFYTVIRWTCNDQYLYIHYIPTNISLSPEEQIHCKQCHIILPQYQWIPADGCRTLQFYHQNALATVEAWQKFISKILYEEIKIKQELMGLQSRRDLKELFSSGNVIAISQS